MPLVKPGLVACGDTPQYGWGVLGKPWPAPGASG